MISLATTLHRSLSLSSNSNSKVINKKQQRVHERHRHQRLHFRLKHRLSTEDEEVMEILRADLQVEVPDVDEGAQKGDVDEEPEELEKETVVEVLGRGAEEEAA